MGGRGSCGGWWRQSLDASNEWDFQRRIDFTFTAVERRSSSGRYLLLRVCVLEEMHCSERGSEGV